MYHCDILIYILFVFVSWLERVVILIMVENHSKQTNKKTIPPYKATPSKQQAPPPGLYCCVATPTLTTWKAPPIVNYILPRTLSHLTVVT